MPEARRRSDSRFWRVAVRLFRSKSALRVLIVSHLKYKTQNRAIAQTPQTLT